MIDIVFNLLLFFLLSSSYVQHSAMEVNLPEASNTPALEGEAVVVDITRDDRFFLQGKEVTLDELKAGISSQYTSPSTDKPLLIRADAKAFHGRVVALLDLARGLGVKSLNVATVPVAEETREQ